MAINITDFVNLIFRILEMLILADVVLSWVMPNGDNDATRIIRSITEPLLIPGRKLQQRFSSELPIDFSPFIALILLDFVKMLIVSVIASR